MQAVPSGIRTHSQNVCSYYKRALRNLEAWYPDFNRFRLEALQLRKQLDDNAKIRDLRVAKHLLKVAEADLEEAWHYQQKKFPYSPGGCAYNREVIPPDWILDYWEPMEKAAYPKYFALREIRKKEYVKFYDKHYPNAQKEFHVHKEY